MGDGYGPIVVARERLSVGALHRTEILVPGKLTTAFLVLKMALGGEFECRVVPSAEILPAVAAGHAAAGLLIHEEMLTYLDSGLEKCLDLGEWWLLETGLPLPLAVNLVRRDLGEAVVAELSQILRESIDAALANRQDALDYARGFGRGMDSVRVDRFIAMYVNELTQDVGDEGRLAVQELLARAEAVGAYEAPVRVEFAA
jgi:1,4-dihydroxy-6-naphthoate synthase